MKNIIAFLVGVIIAFAGVQFFSPMIVSSTFGATELTTITNPFTFQKAVTFQSTVSNTGTTTVTQSVDGMVAGGTMSTAATGTARTIYTNSTGPKFCDASTAFLYVKNNGSFAPSVVFGIGTSTGTVPTNNVVASTTVATSTTALVVPTNTSFILAQGESIIGIMGDITNAAASSTYFGNWSAEFGVWCQDIAI